MPDISAVVFDLGGVLIDWNPRHLYRKLVSDDPDRIEWFLSNICTPEWNALQDAGRTFAEATTELVTRHPEHRDLIEAYYGRWKEMLGGPIEGSVDILRAIRKSDLNLYALTNWSAESFPVALEIFDFLNWFEGIVVSGEIGMIKPDDAIFHHMIETFGLEPSASVFIDDSAPNVATAQRLGFHAIRFLDPDQLRADLHTIGVALNGIEDH
ncbi:MAG: HAD family phosphatase [Rhodothermales bacterium]